MTAEQVRKKLGLEPFKRFSEKSRKRLAKASIYSAEEMVAEPRLWRRQTGRTTETLCRVLAAASAGELVVLLLPRGARYAKIVRERMRDMARGAGIEDAVKNVTVETVKLSVHYHRAFADHLLP